MIIPTTMKIIPCLTLLLSCQFLITFAFNSISRSSFHNHQAPFSSSSTFIRTNRNKYQSFTSFFPPQSLWNEQQSIFVQKNKNALHGWVQDEEGEWEWVEDDPAFMEASTKALSGGETTTTTTTTTMEIAASATPTLPSGKFRPKQSLGQNYLRDGNTVLKFIKTFLQDAQRASDYGQETYDDPPGLRVVELGPGAGALTDVLLSMPQLSSSSSSNTENTFTCIEIDPRAVELLSEKHPSLSILHQDVLQTNYPLLSEKLGGPLHIVGNLPYYITSQILFALADASHVGAVRCATVTMQWEVARRIVSPTKSKDYGILSVVFQLYTSSTSPTLHFKIPPTVFYPQPKVDSALVNFEFLPPSQLHKKFLGVKPQNLRTVLTTSFQQRRKTIRNSLKKLALEVCEGDKERAAELLQSRPSFVPAEEERQLPVDWFKKRPEELNPLQFVELARLFFGPNDYNEDDVVAFVDNGDVSSDLNNDEEIISNEEETALNHHGLGKKVWRKLKHGDNN